MNGKIDDTRTIKNGLDKNGKRKENLKVYDVYYRYKDPSTGRWKQTSKKGFRTRREAEAFLLEINTQLNNNTFVPLKKITVKEYLEEWITEYVETNLKKSTISSYTSIIRLHITPMLGNIELQKLTSSHIDNFYSQKIKSGRLDGKGGLSNKSVLYIHRILTEALDHATKKGKIVSNPIKKITNIPKAQKYKAQIYEANEIIQLLETTKDSDIECPIVLAALCGLRRGEVLGLKWNNVDFENSVIKINNQLISTDDGFYFDTPKTESSIRNIFPAASVFKILEIHKLKQSDYKKAFKDKYMDEGLVYCNNDGTPVNPKSFSKRFSYFLKKNNLKHIRFHDLRHSYASLSLKLGSQLKVTSEILGHSNINITADTYTHVADDLKKDIANRIDKMLTPILTNTSSEL
jgi:integrase